MNGRAHMIAGAASAAPVVVYAGLDTPTDALTAIGMIILGAWCGLAPDLDHPHRCLASRILGPFGPFASLLARGFSKSARQVATEYDRQDFRWKLVRGRDLEHRALTHTPIAALMVAVTAGMGIALLTPGPVWQAPLVMFSGWMSHILLDACTKDGVPLLWPLPYKGRCWHRIRFSRLTSCTWTDWPVAWTWVGLCAALSTLLA